MARPKPCAGRTEAQAPVQDARSRRLRPWQLACRLGRGSKRARQARSAVSTGDSPSIMLLALDDALGDVAGHLVGDRLDLRRFGQHDAAVAGVLDEAVGAMVAPHRDVADRVDPQPRLQARRDGEVENVDVGRHLGEDRRQFGREKLQPHARRLAQFDHDILAVGGGVLDLADRSDSLRWSAGVLCLSAISLIRQAPAC